MSLLNVDTEFTQPYVNLTFRITHNNLVAVHTCYDSYTASTQASVNDDSGLIFPIFKPLNIYITKSTMGAVDPLKGPTSDLMTC